MITDADIKRINELYHKSKSEGLTPEEKQEQVKLREAYIESVRANMRSQLNNIDVKRPDGSIVSLKEQAAQNLAKKKLILVKQRKPCARQFFKKGGIWMRRSADSMAGSLREKSLICRNIKRQIRFYATLPVKVKQTPGY